MQGCAGAFIALEAIPGVIGVTAMANAESRSPWNPRIPPPSPSPRDELVTLDGEILRAQCGDAPAQFLLAERLANQFNTTPNYIEIYKWYALSDRGGFEPASERLLALNAQMSQADIAQAQQRARGWRASSEGCDATG